MDQSTFRRWVAVYQAALDQPTNGGELWHPRFAAGWMTGYAAGASATAHGVTDAGYQALVEAYDAGHAAGLRAGHERRDAEVVTRATEAAALGLRRIRPRPVRFGPATSVRSISECLATWNLPATDQRAAA